MRFTVLTLSDRSYAGIRPDQSGPLAVKILKEAFAGSAIETAILPDDRKAIREKLLESSANGYSDLIITTGGTGLAPRDVTPEATRDVLEREIPGISEAARAAGLAKTPHAMLSRGVCGTRGKTLIINLPGSPKAVAEYLSLLTPVIRHVLDLLSGLKEACDSLPIMAPTSEGERSPSSAPELD
ncbi:MAG: MogA/MoaB family molybdenum cofactor biosynthesis protein [Nitrospiraceae bacterium]|jgi:molybdenum cofactor synthesis domain-containing protein|nr:MogA/MoaB family molybdenum cofactor biosynthesis protein [Nitrospiraceae bacterium]